jgi:hypothetical protein
MHADPVAPVLLGVVQRLVGAAQDVFLPMLPAMIMPPSAQATTSVNESILFPGNCRF